MQPQQTPQPAPPPMMAPSGPRDPYDFIMNSGGSAKKSPLPGGDSKTGRIIIVALMAVVLLIVVSVVASVISKSGQGGTSDLVDLAARQQELIRVSELGRTSAKTQEAQNLAITAELSFTSDQKQLISLLAQGGVKVSAANLNLRKNSQTDTLLNQATQNNQFDEIFTKTLRSQITNYQTALQTAFKSNTGPKTKALLNQEFANTKALLGPTTASTN